MTTSTLTVTEFVLARIAEDEAAARGAADGDEYEWSIPFAFVDHVERQSPARVLAQCAAMRKIVERAAWVLANPTKVSHDDFCRAKADLFDLADVFRDHPDHVWGDVVHITRESYDEAMALLDAEGKR